MPSDPAEPKSIAMESFQGIFARHTAGIKLSPGASKLAQRTIGRGAAYFDRSLVAQSEELDDASRRLDETVGAIVTELEATGTWEVSEQALASAMRAHCPFPPFCYPEDVQAESEASDD